MGLFFDEEEKVAGFLIGDRHLPLVDAVGVLDDEGVGRLAEDLVEAHDGGDARGDQIVEDITGTDRGELIDIPHKEKVTVNRNRFEQAVGEDEVEHGGFVDDDHVGVYGVVFAAGKPFVRFEFEEAMDRFRFTAGRFGEPFGGAAGGGGEDIGRFEGVEGVEQGAHGGRFAGAGAAGEDGHFVAQGGGDGRFLLVAELENAAGLGVGEGGGSAATDAAGGVFDEAADSIGDADFGVVEGGEVDGRFFADFLRLFVDFCLTGWVVGDLLPLDEVVVFEGVDDVADLFVGEGQDLGGGGF